MTRTILRPLAAALAGSLLLSTGVAQDGAESVWCDDYDVAVARAKKEKKDLLVDFTGSDWCGYCIKLDKQVFSKQEFVDAVKDKYVLVALDYPRGDAAKAKVPNPKRNDQLAAFYGISGYPTVLLLTVDGDVIARTGWEDVGPAMYASSVDRLAIEGRRNLEPMLGLHRRFARSKKKQQIDVVREGVDNLLQMTREHVGVRGMARLAKHALKLDKRNKLGLLHDAIRGIVLVGAADEDVLKVVRKDKKNKAGLLDLLAVDAVVKVHGEESIPGAIAAVEQVAKVGFKDDSLAAYVLTNAAVWADEVLKDAARAKDLAKKALDSGVEPGQRARLKKIANG